MGRCLGRRLSDAGFSIGNISCRSRESAVEAQRFIGAGSVSEPAQGLLRAAATATVIIIGTPDRAISSIETHLAPHVGKEHIVLHLSGSLPSSLMKHCGEQGAAIGSMHPLQSFADPEAALKILDGSVFACEGDERAVEAGMVLAKAVGGEPIRIRTKSKSIYHAAAAAASNFMIAPLLLALDLMKTAGLDRKTALKALAPLIRGTAKNAVNVGVPEALTGPIERNDFLVIQGHLQSIARQCPESFDSYKALARLTVEAAQRKGKLSEEDVARLLDLLAVDITELL